MKKFLILLLALLCLTGVCFAEEDERFVFEGPTASEAKARWTDGTETFEGTFGECLVKVNEKGGTLTMLDDVKEAGDHPTMRNDIDDADYIVGSNKVFTLDMNGHTLCTETIGAIYVNGGEEGGVFVVKNGTIISLVAENIYVANAGLQAINVQMRSGKSQNISFYDTTGKYNKDNLIDGCTIVNPIWYCFSFNNVEAGDQSAASVTIINSRLGAMTSYGGVGHPKKANGGNVVLGENVEIVSYGKDPVGGKVVTLGEPYIKEASDVTVEFLDLVYDMTNVWYTPEKPTMNIADVIPGDGEATMENSPALRQVTIVPLEEQKAALEEAEKAEKELAESTEPAEKSEAASNTGLIIGIVAAVVIVAVAAALVSKKKKK